MKALIAHVSKKLQKKLQSSYCLWSNALVSTFEEFVRYTIQIFVKFSALFAEDNSQENKTLSSPLIGDCDVLLFSVQSCICQMKATE